MSSLRDRINDAVNQHTDVFLLGTAVVVLFLAVTVFLWSRRANRLQRKVEELESNRDALKQLLRRPETVTVGGARRPEPSTAATAAPVTTRGGRDVYSVGSRTETAPDGATPPAAQDPAGAAIRRLETLADAPALPTEAASEAASGAAPSDAPADAATPPDPKKAIPDTWRSAEEDVTPPAAAWAASPAPARHAPPTTDFAAISFASLRSEAPARRADDPAPPAAIAPFEVEEPAVVEAPAAAEPAAQDAAEATAAPVEMTTAAEEPAPFAEPAAEEPAWIAQPATEDPAPAAEEPAWIAEPAAEDPASAAEEPAWTTERAAAEEPSSAAPSGGAEPVTPTADTEDAPPSFDTWAVAPQPARSGGPAFTFGPPPAAADLEPAAAAPAFLAELEASSETALPAELEQARPEQARPDPATDPTDFTLPAHVALPVSDLVHVDPIADLVDVDPVAEAAPLPEPAHGPEPAHAVDAASAVDPDPARPRTQLQESYDAWETLSRADRGATPPASGRPGDPAYTAWSEVTSHGDTPSEPVRLADLGAPPSVPDPLPANGNGRPHADTSVTDNAAHGGEGGDLADLTTLATRSTMPAPTGPAAGPTSVDDAAAPAEATPATPAPPAPAPAAGQRNGSTTPEPADADPAGGILLVEDDDNVAKIYRLVLESKGHTVRHAADGVAALDEVRSGRPDLVLLDVMMPRMNGILFLQSLRAQPELRDVPVVILSNFREPRLVERAMALGALEYVVKAQTRPDVLINAIPRWLAGERAFSR